MIISRLVHLISASLFTVLIMWVYQVNVAEYYSYMGFRRLDSSLSITVAFGLSVALSVFIPKVFSTRSFFLLLFHYSFFIPSFITAASNDLDWTHLSGLLSAFFLIYTMSALPLKHVKLKSLNAKVCLAVCLAFLIIIFSQVFQRLLPRSPLFWQFTSEVKFFF